MLCFMLFWLPTAQAAEDTHNSSIITGDPHFEEAEEEEHIESAYAVLFPSFTLTLGVCVFLLLSRYIHALPYTAVMFILGTIMGIGAELIDNTKDHINESIRLWIPIDSEVLLLVFLPGLIFKDSFGLNVHLFRMATTQCLIFAFPLVLAGTALTALIAKYIFPYDWSLDLCFTFGSILAATDPVAVAALMEQVGAPPRLKIHISGEALLNDGAAIVFFSIFSKRFYYLLNVEGLGEDVGWATGIALFFQKSLGGVAIGLFFGLGLLLFLRLLNRRFNREENVVEVMGTAAIAYTGYYVSDFVWATSGVISTMTTGLVVKFLGRAFINDLKLLDDFWTLMEHILNTVLFTLGGVVWGAVIARGERDGVFTAKDWGYMLLLYVLLHLMRVLQFLAVYPVTKRIGLSTNMAETAFQVFGGLRGAVGIALALALDNRVNAAGADPIFAEQTTTLFAMVGGVAFLTLVINGVLAAPLIRYLGLTQSTEAREKIINAYETRYKLAMIDEMVRLLTQPRFIMVNFALVKHHVPLLRDLTRQQLRDAVEKYRETTPAEDYKPPFLKRILPYLPEDAEEKLYQQKRILDQTEDVLDTEAYARKLRHDQRTKLRRRRRQSSMRFMMSGEPLTAMEMRLLFISIMKAAYDQQVNDGELADQEFLTVSLHQSLDFAEDAVSKGQPLQDWDYVTFVDGPVQSAYKHAKKSSLMKKFFETASSGLNLKHKVKTLDIERSLAFMEAHRWAADYFLKEFQGVDKELAEAGKYVLMESQIQWKKAAAVLEKYDEKDVTDVVSHKFCSIVLNSAVKYIEKLVEVGLMNESEAEHHVEEIEHYLKDVHTCRNFDHPGELPVASYNDQQEQEISQFHLRATPKRSQHSTSHSIPEEEEEAHPGSSFFLAS
ncbi:hypothetical protein FisN_24Lh041 [Fistulifera solaris]|uniref:Cation/H+ exchanger transmembrane domain-containing protein n=1 Tax=Fistulifera solaris TaxID=1519565 RepID=A0A1Z5KTD8_FISSO|nr:hypothetical protein FisN_24Lh041 [Fistulifera solaris]|eukprot:GAX29583.1 hypothetical protein FisN_24Lh041 [Fistulifera solaris]